jgi:hypothetical protein
LLRVNEKTVEQGGVTRIQGWLRPSSSERREELLAIEPLE